MCAVGVADREILERQFGAAAAAGVNEALAMALIAKLPGARLVDVSAAGAVLVVPKQNAATAERALGLARASISDMLVPAGSELIPVTPIVGYVVAPGDSAKARSQALAALDSAAVRMDLVPVQWTASRVPASRENGAQSWFARHRLAWQITLTLLLVLVVPYFGYTLLAALGWLHPTISIVYVVITLALLGTAIAIYAESFSALDPVRPPARPSAEAPPATAIIAAYLPNEAATIVETVRVFLGLHYPAGLQIILAYNTPGPLPVEAELAEIAARDDRLLLLNVANSRSKATNVNAALQYVTGDIVGLFDADHHPAQDAFDRAWRWLSNGYGVVQGHCLIRNGATSWVSRLVAVEFESIYALSHPGRTQLHGFGIFGGSNGYWHAELLRSVRLRGTMLTEDIDSSIRVNLRGIRIATDPGLISRELAPTTLPVLAGQRLRWAQGWSQVSLEYALSAIRSSRLSVRQKLGTLFLLGWREVYPWLSPQMIPLVVYVLLHPSNKPFNWFIPILALSTIVTYFAGPTQTFIAYLVAAPEIRQHRRWFLRYAVLNAIFYTEFKNTLGRVAHIKHLLREDQWVVTARDPGTATPTVAVAIPERALEPSS